GGRDPQEAFIPSPDNSIASALPCSSGPRTMTPGAGGFTVASASIEATWESELALPISHSPSTLTIIARMFLKLILSLVTVILTMQGFGSLRRNQRPIAI